MWRDCEEVPWYLVLRKMGIERRDGFDACLLPIEAAAALNAITLSFAIFSSLQLYPENCTPETSFFAIGLLKMAFFSNKATIFSRLRPYSQNADCSLTLARRGIHSHVEAGDREKALLAKDPALEPFKSHKKSVKRLKRVGDVLTIVVVAGCCYEIYVRAVMREEARKQARESANS
ncbi:hypothetical protein RJ640_005279 [Escallonia rubra]|uniref:Uncharacterized protein n=1 Tax=Escallonia rubra TaxID=112253 RepID=A0AA88U1C9_9ASTE|nr:hypothetical protein RJ640_005279 [Escallonia rubra]